VAAGDLDARVDVRSEGETRALVESFNEMTGRLRAQRIEIERLARLAAWRDIARAVAHELKNPLTPIHLAVQETRDAYHGDDPEYQRLLQECASIVDEEVRRLRDLVREFSEFARFPTPDPQEGDLAETLCEVARLYGERVVFERPPAAVPSRYDDAQIRRAVVNLVENGLAACRAAGRREEVRIAIEAAGPRAAAIVRVEDRGSGIAPEHLPRIFEPDFSTRKEGMGMGLAIVETVARGHGGRIEVKSRVGEGTTMSLVLPAGDPAIAGEES
jgi:nitrogen fixation/metabolism regulation signal transduction histidine kinase